MLLYGGVGLLLGGIITYFFSDKIQSEPTKASRMRKQSPILMLVGTGLLGLSVLVGGA
jgi:hypothetical protein